MIELKLFFWVAGLILQNGTCIAASQCPCVYHGTSYIQGQVLQQGCSVWWVWTAGERAPFDMCRWFVALFNFSVCMGGVWNCTENNCTGENQDCVVTEKEGSSSDNLSHSFFCLFLAECTVVGDVFVTTFDGRMFLQPGACQYVLAKSRSSNRFTVTLQYTTCSEVSQTHVS